MTRRHQLEPGVNGMIFGISWSEVPMAQTQGCGNCGRQRTGCLTVVLSGRGVDHSICQECLLVEVKHLLVDLNVASPTQTSNDSASSILPE
jgi:hypothetical protein